MSDGTVGAGAPDGGSAISTEGAAVLAPAEAAPASGAVIEGTAAVVEPTAETQTEAPAEGTAEAGAETATEAPTSLLSGEETPEEKAAAEAAEKAAAEPLVPEPIAYEEWTLPENVSLAPEQADELNTLLNEGGVPQEFGQKLVDYGAGLIKANVEAVQQKLVQDQLDAWAKTNSDWQKEFDRQAGNQRETIRADAKAAIRAAVPDDGQRQQVLDALAVTGAGNHPAIINLLAALGKQQRERSAPSTSLPISKPTSAAERRYGAGRRT